jgi:hypothetical protein
MTMYDRYRHIFTVSAVRTPAGISWSLEDTEVGKAIFDMKNECWSDMAPGQLTDDDNKMMNILTQRLQIELGM